ncbi:MAG: helix-turn-helix transcriptional regulator [Lachnospiraceae bacterium]|nr:helix-turn-helix transcriptional regulator [Lachnospiraceae bacterium]
MSSLYIKFPHIREIREEFGLSQEDMAKYLHISQVAYSYYELGRRDIPTDILVEIADRFGCSTDYLLNRTNNRDRIK